jgi:hypothetical protein
VKIYALTTDDCDSATRVLALSTDRRKIAGRALEIMGTIEFGDPEDGLVEPVRRAVRAELAAFVEGKESAPYSPQVWWLSTGDIDLSLWIEEHELD